MGSPSTVSYVRIHKVGPHVPPNGVTQGWSHMLCPTVGPQWNVPQGGPRYWRFPKGGLQASPMGRHQMGLHKSVPQVCSPRRVTARGFPEAVSLKGFRTWVYRQGGSSKVGSQELSHGFARTDCNSRVVAEIVPSKMVAQRGPSTVVAKTELPEVAPKSFPTEDSQGVP